MKKVWCHVLVTVLRLLLNIELIIYCSTFRIVQTTDTVWPSLPSGVSSYMTIQLSEQINYDKGLMSCFGHIIVVAGKGRTKLIVCFLLRAETNRVGSKNILFWKIILYIDVVIVWMIRHVMMIHWTCLHGIIAILIEFIELKKIIHNPRSRQLIYLWDSSWPTQMDGLFVLVWQTRDRSVLHYLLYRNRKQTFFTPKYKSMMC